jgi:cation-transporting ATPase E
MRLGAPEYVLDAEALAANQALIKARTAQGRRVLVFAMDEEAAGDRDGRSSRRSAMPLLFVALHNDIRDGARDTFAGFAQRGVEIKVISGDNPVTVSKVAKDAGIAHADRYVDATSLDTPDKIASAIGVYTVFGRVQPEQKKELVEALKAKGLRVAMTGDGVNDILAMKEADCSIAMGSGSDAARQAAQVVLLDSDFSHMNEIVSEGRRDINNITRSATLFLYKNIFSLSLALFTIFGSFVYPLTPNQVSLISMFNIGLPAFLLAFEPNEERQHGRFVVEVLLRSLPAALTSFAAIGTMILFADLFGISHGDVATASTYLLSVVGFLILADITRPLNRYRTMVFAVCIAGLIGGCGFFYQLFDIYRLSLKGWVLCVVFAFAEVGVLRILSGLLDFVRARLSLRFG